MGTRAAGRWCSSITKTRWGQCMGCTGRQMQSLRCSVPSRGQSQRPSYVSLGKLSVLLWRTLTTKGIFDGLWRGEMRCIGPRAKDADLWIMVWEELHRAHQEGTLVEGRARQSTPFHDGNAACVAL